MFPKTITLLLLVGLYAVVGGLALPAGQLLNDDDKNLYIGCFESLRPAVDRAPGSSDVQQGNAIACMDWCHEHFYR